MSEISELSNVSSDTAMPLAFLHETESFYRGRARANLASLKRSLEAQMEHEFDSQLSGKRNDVSSAIKLIDGGL